MTISIQLQIQMVLCALDDAGAARPEREPVRRPYAGGSGWGARAEAAHWDGDGESFPHPRRAGLLAVVRGGRQWLVVVKFLMHHPACDPGAEAGDMNGE